jgi:hypothetical protein
VIVSRRDRPKSTTRSVLTGLGLALGVGLALGWVSVFLIPRAISLGLSEARAQKLPFVGFVIGAAWGVLAPVSKNAKDLLSGVVVVTVMGGVFYCFGLFMGAVLLIVGLSEETVDWIPPIAFFVGAALGLLPLVGFGRDIVSSFGRAGRWQRDREPQDGGDS